MKNTSVLSLFILMILLGGHTSGQETVALKVCEDCLQDEFRKTFTASTVALPPTHKDSVSFTLSYSSSKTQKALLYVGDSEYIKVTYGVKTLKAGKFTSKSELKQPFARYLIPLTLQSGRNDFLVQMSQNDHKFFTVQPKLILGAEIEDVIPLYYAQNEPARSANLVSILLLSLLLLYSLYQALILKNRIYRSYGLYLLSIVLFLFLFSDEYLQWHLLLPKHLELYGAVNIIPQGIIYVVYTEFGLVLLDIKKKYKWIYKVSRVFQILTLLITFTHAGYLIFSGGDQAFIFTYFFKVYALLGIISTYMTFYILFRIKDSLKWFLLVGSTIIGWAVGYEIFQIFVKGSPKPRDFFYTLPGGFMHFSFLELSYVVESLIFLMGINFKNLRKERENIALKERLIKQLKEKEQLEKQVNELLSHKLKQSEKDLAIEKMMAEGERNKAKLMESQLSSLQLQMNPHYLFNSLNSINDFIISKKPEEASEYLALYARMMRNILKNSERIFNTLDQELQFCEDYLKLESLRFDDRFEYSVIRPKHLSTLEKLVPGMMLQPILENAVWHGIMPLKGKGIVILDASQSSEKEVVIEISDNGGGIENLGITPPNESYGLKNIKDKIDLLFKMYQKQVTFEMINLENKQGFKVRFVFPEMDRA